MFTLMFSVTSNNIDAVKIELTRTLKNIKSSHRCEALARGLGFQTYAALRAASQSGLSQVVTANGNFFCSYLTERGFKTLPKSFYFAIARVAIRNVCEREPNLTAEGIGISRPRRADGFFAGSQERIDKFNTERKALLDDTEIEPFLLSLAFLANIEKTKTIRENTNSYGLKHVAEKYPCTYPEGNQLGPQYIGNGTFIAAALHAGFKIKQVHNIYTPEHNSLNVQFNMSSRSLDQMRFPRKHNLKLF